MISSFKNFLIEEDKTIFFTFGRVNPPTTGHGFLLDVLAQKSGSNPYRVYLSQSQDSKKNPLDYPTKIKFARKMFPRHARSILMDRSVKNVFDILVKLYDEGYKNVVMVVGSDRVNEFEILMKKYDGVQGRHGFYKFNSIKAVSAGERDPDADDVSGMSASKQRKNAAENDFAAFSQGLPKKLSNSDAKALFNAIRKGMGLNEEKSFKRHLELAPISIEREEFVRGNLFQIGEEVVIKSTEEMGKIIRLGTNYVVVECNGKTYRKWIDDVELVEKIEVAQDKDIDELPGSQPATFQKGIKSKSTKAARHRHFQRMSKKDDDDPSAYKDAPGDKAARKKGTKPSQYTKKFKQMFGDDINENADAALQNKAEKSGFSLAILKQVYKRGVAAWKVGHKPGTTPQQWGMARVNSFITGGRTRVKGDPDLWAKQKAMLAKKKG